MYVLSQFSGLQRLLNICCVYAAHNEIVFNCNKTIGVVFPSKKFYQLALPEWRKCILPTTSYKAEVCMDWILDFLDPDSCCLQQNQE